MAQMGVVFALRACARGVWGHAPPGKFWTFRPSTSRGNRYFEEEPLIGKYKRTGSVADQRKTKRPCKLQDEHFR